ncbi:P1 family peptidase [Phenylobacterium sp.]|uniref:P1 family peptidase n=1 Tax=Phenylobacterium sp. TaxID=1871053 RepID=UPI002FC6A328
MSNRQNGGQGPWSRALGFSILLAAGATQVVAAPQDALTPVINGAAPQTLTFDWPMLRIGTGEYEEGPTGVTVFRFGRKVLGAVDVRGGGPGTVNADFLRLGYEAPELDAVVFSGGSWYGLESVTAANTALKDDGERGGHWDNVGLAVGSIIYDFGARRLNEIYPDKRLAQATLRAAQPGVFAQGPHGAGRSAVSGGLFGCNAHSGQGGAFRQIGQVKIAVFTVVNALGVVTDRDGRVVACHPDKGWPQDLKASDLMGATPDSLKPGWNGARAAAPDRKNTTISLVVTNRKLNPAELQRVAVQVHTSMARAIQPFATELDGDVLYAVSTAEVDAGPGDGLVSAEIGTVASELMWDAILAAVPAQPQGPAPTAVASNPTALARHAGEYRFSELASLQVTVKDGRLFGQATGSRDVFAIKRDAPAELVAVSDSEFAVPGRYPLTLRFEGDKVVINPGRWQQVGARARR